MSKSRIRQWLEKRMQWQTDAGTTGNPLMTLLNALIGGEKSAAGIPMDEHKALALATVYACVDVIAKTVGALPLHVYRREDAGGRKVAMRHWAYPLLHDSPNEYHTSFDWRHVMLTHVLLWGNAYSRIEWLGNGSASALLPLMPWDVEPKLTSGGAKYYAVRLPDGNFEDLPDDEVMHVKALSYDGLRGISPIRKLRDSLGLAKAAESFSADFFANHAQPGVVMEVPKRLDEKAQKNLTESVAARFAGAGNRFGVMVLEEGAKMHTVTMPPKDAEFIEQRKFQRTEICGWYGVPPVFVGDYEKANFANSEQQDLSFAKHTITPWCVRIEQELNRKLFIRGSGFYCKFSLEGLLRGDFKTRMDGLQIAVGGPFLTRNEARELEDWNAIEGADELLTPLNLGVGAKPEPVEPKEPAPAAAPAPAEPDDRSVTVNVAPPAVHVSPPSVRVNVSPNGDVVQSAQGGNRKIDRTVIRDPETGLIQRVIDTVIEE
jgi:HK97 family phage portal protein